MKKPRRSILKGQPSADAAAEEELTVKVETEPVVVSVTTVKKRVSFSARKEIKMFGEKLQKQFTVPDVSSDATDTSSNPMDMTMLDPPSPIHPPTGDVGRANDFSMVGFVEDRQNEETSSNVLKDVAGASSIGMDMTALHKGSTWNDSVEASVIMDFSAITLPAKMRLKDTSEFHSTMANSTFTVSHVMDMTSTKKSFSKTVYDASMTMDESVIESARNCVENDVLHDDSDDNDTSANVMEMTLTKAVHSNCANEKDFNMEMTQYGLDRTKNHPKDCTFVIPNVSSNSTFTGNYAMDMTYCKEASRHGDVSMAMEFSVFENPKNIKEVHVPDVVSTSDVTCSSHAMDMTHYKESTNNMKHEDVSLWMDITGMNPNSNKDEESGLFMDMTTVGGGIPKASDLTKDNTLAMEMTQVQPSLIIKSKHKIPEPYAFEEEPSLCMDLTTLRGAIPVASDLQRDKTMAMDMTHIQPSCNKWKPATPAAFTSDIETQFPRKRATAQDSPKVDPQDKRKMKRCTGSSQQQVPPLANSMFGQFGSAKTPKRRVPQKLEEIVRPVAGPPKEAEKQVGVQNNIPTPDQSRCLRELQVSHSEIAKPDSPIIRNMKFKVKRNPGRPPRPPRSYTGNDISVAPVETQRVMPFDLRESCVTPPVEPCPAQVAHCVSKIIETPLDITAAHSILTTSYTNNISPQATFSTSRIRHDATLAKGEEECVVKPLNYFSVNSILHPTRSLNVVLPRSPQLSLAPTSKIQLNKTSLRIEEHNVETEERYVKIEENMVETEERFVETEEPNIETEERFVETEEPNIETEERFVETEEPNIETEERFVETDEPNIETEERYVETEEHNVKTEEEVYCHDDEDLIAPPSPYSVTLDEGYRRNVSTAALKSAHSPLLEDRPSKMENEATSLEQPEKAAQSLAHMTLNDLEITSTSSDLLSDFRVLPGVHNCSQVPKTIRTQPIARFPLPAQFVDETVNLFDESSDLSCSIDSPSIGILPENMREKIGAIKTSCGIKRVQLLESFTNDLMSADIDTFNRALRHLTGYIPPTYIHEQQQFREFLRINESNKASGQCSPVTRVEMKRRFAMICGGRKFKKT